MPFVTPRVRCPEAGIRRTGHLLADRAGGTEGGEDGVTSASARRDAGVNFSRTNDHASFEIRTDRSVSKRFRRRKSAGNLPSPNKGVDLPAAGKVGS